MDWKLGGLISCIALVACTAERPVPAPPLVAEAKVEQAKPTESEIQENCTLWAQYAATVMQARQSGAAMSKIMSIATDNGSIDPMKKQIVIDAYESPQMSVESNQERMTREFENKYYLACTNAAP